MPCGSPNSSHGCIPKTKWSVRFTGPCCVHGAHSETNLPVRNGVPDRADRVAGFIRARRDACGHGTHSAKHDESGIQLFRTRVPKPASPARPAPKMSRVTGSGRVAGAGGSENAKTKSL